MEKLFTLYQPLKRGAKLTKGSMTTIICRQVFDIINLYKGLRLGTSSHSDPQATPHGQLARHICRTANSAATLRAAYSAPTARRCAAASRVARSLRFDPSVVDVVVVLVAAVVVGCADAFRAFPSLLPSSQLLPCSQLCRLWRMPGR